eukprot:CAMPEP_0196660666 /NCGR_PEP_ID=MMETSP1086-20130531/40821_1 /TAXON_ID=77921 /ORGANISM="Cyanoptyche  gloeocystis , Strain SAG4.97" /LENGTH=44 /DNA_ID= /DNA_START= /DNA_END= /DNA_ORIENTATION=
MEDDADQQKRQFEMQGSFECMVPGFEGKNTSRIKYEGHDYMCNA